MELEFVYIGAKRRRQRVAPPISSSSLSLSLSSSSAEGHGEDRFLILFTEIKYRILARLDSESLVSAKLVCREWSQLLRRSSIQSLTVNQGISTRPTFLLRVCHTRRDPSERTQEARRVSRVSGMSAPKKVDVVEAFVTVESNGTCKAVDMLNSIHHVCRHWDVTCKGILASFPEKFCNDGVNDKVVLCHPSLEWVERVPVDVTSELSRPLVKYYNRNKGLRGVCYDPSTSHFTLLIGFDKWIWKPCYEVHIYSSLSKDWRIVELKMGYEDAFDVHESGLFSNGCFLWLDKSFRREVHRGLVVFDLENELFYMMHLPDCPLHPSKGSADPCYKEGKTETKWELKGCDGYVVLVHHSRSRGKLPGINDVVIWRLGQDMRRPTWEVVLHLSEVPICPKYGLFDTNRSGWWLWANDRISERERDLVILDDNGDVQHSIPLSSLSSFLVNSSDGYVSVGNVWSLETNNLWNTLAFS